MLNSTLKKFISYYFIFSLFLFFPFAPIKAQSFTESFKYSTVPSSLHMDGAPSAFLTGGFGTRDGYNDANGNGYLRLTNTNSTQKSILWSTIPFSSAKEISASFEYYIHSGTGGDGIAFILFDENTPNPQPGEFGGSLGYAQANGGSGFTNGYLGIGIDEYGNFSSNDEGRSGGPGSRESAIVLRGKGSGISGYPYLTGAQTYALPLSFNLAGNDRTATDPSKPGFRKIDILLKPRSGGGFFVSVYLTHGNIKSLVINNYEYSTTAPPNLKFAITASTGLYTDFHEIRNLNVSSLYSPIANPDSFSGIVGVPATSADITANDNGTVNPGASLDKASVDLDLDTPGIQNSITVPEKGTFTYDSSTGKITFTPLNNTVEGSIQINYTFNDTYAKTSTVATITYTTIKLTGVNICPGDTGSLMIESSGARLTTTFSGHWNSQTDPQAFLPTNTLMSTTCNFSIISSRNYTATQFSVTQTGIYSLKMTDTDDYDGLAYIYSGNFVPGNCNGGGTWIIGDDDSDGLRKEPKLITLLQSGVTYTLISTLWANNIGVYAGDYTWTITPPPGGGFSLTPLNYWYTSPSGGIPIGWGTTFDPVGVANSGLADTNTAGTTMYYVGDETNAPRFPVSFTIKPETYAGLASSTPTVCLNTNLVAITHTTLNSTGIGSPTGLPSGITATWAANLITISGTPTVSGTFNYSIPLIGECGNNAATGTIIVPSKPATVERNESICFGGSYTWNVTGITYSTAGTYTKTNDGCTADQVLNLSIGTKPVTVATNENICFGKSYTWEVTGLTYSASGTYTKTNDGCTADQVLNLTVTPKPADNITTESICSGQSYTWPADGLAYNTSQSGLRITNNGCTADQVLNLTVTPKPADIITTESICFGQSYIWPADGLAYNTSQSGLRITNNGCTADQVLNLTVTPKPAAVVKDHNICFGNSYTWDVTGTTYDAAGTYTKTNDGCTADQVLNLTFALPLTSSVIANGIIPEYCAGDNNGEFGIDISGGIAPYNVSLNNSTGIYEQVIGTEHYFSNISGNTQIVYIKDALDCTFELQVSMPESVILNPVATVNYGCSLNSATITIEGSTDLLDVDYALDNGNYQRDNIFTNLSAGSHTITARHSTGCTQSTEPFLIKHMEPLELSLADGELNEIVATTKGGGGEYQYSFEDQTYSDNNKFIIYKSGNYKVTVTDKYGCSTTATQYLAYIDICIPIYFTPNGDGVNDEWGPDCTVNYKNLTYTIIDRYGREIANYNYGQKWDGKYNGKELTSGDYWYVIKLNDPKDNREFVGHFTLYR